MRSGNETGEIKAKENADWAKAAISALFALGLPPKLKGFGYTLGAILVYRQDPAQSIMKDIYPAVARLQSSGVSPAQVERNIRWAIASAWKNRDETVWARFFRDSQNICKRKPTNLEFISRIAWYIEFRRSNPGDDKENTDLPFYTNF